MSQVQYDPVEILDGVGARQWRAEDGTWTISIPRNQDRPSTQWALRELAKAADKQPCVLWVKRRE